MFPFVPLSDHIPSHCCDLEREPASQWMGFHLVVQHAVYWSQGIWKKKSVVSGTVSNFQALCVSGCCILALQMTLQEFQVWRGRDFPDLNRAMFETQMRIIYLYSGYTVHSEKPDKHSRAQLWCTWVIQQFCPLGEDISKTPEIAVPGKECLEEQLPASAE